MKQKQFKIALFSTITLLGICFTSLACIQSNKVPLEANALELPTSVSLKDNTESEIRSYYSYLNTLPESERRGTNLLKNLKYILVNNPSNTAKPAQYFSYAQVRKIYNITDRQWQASPASSIASFDSATNTIGTVDYTETPYLYYYYCSDNFTSPHLSNASETSSTGSSQTMLNQEHLWSKSHGFAGTGSGEPNAGSDLHHLVAADAAVNKWAHSNYSYGNVGTVDSSWTTNQTNWDNGRNTILGNKKGTPVTAHTGDEGTTVFEPQDIDKGDIARALFFMAARYNYYGGDATQASVLEPNLELVDRVIDTAMDCNGTNGAAQYGVVSDLVQWNKDDPTTTSTDTGAYEIHRNNLIYNNYQNTRNPFIDFPEWVDYVWGDKKDTGVASPATDTINGFNTGSVTAPTAITLNALTTNIALGGTFSASVASVTPTDASKSVTWSSNNSAVASVDGSGVISGAGVGQAIISATSTLDSNVNASITVNVSGVSLTSISFSASSLDINVGNTSTLAVTYNPDNASNKTVTWSSDNSGVASVIDGTVTGISAGSTTIRAVSQDGSHAASIIVNVQSVVSGYTKVSALSDVVSGKYVIASAYNSAYYAMSNAIPTKAGSIAATVVTVTNNEITASDGASYVVDIVVSGTTITIANGANYLTRTGTSTDLIASSTASSWDLTLVSEGVFNIKDATSARSLAFSTSGTYFKAYAKITDSYLNVGLFKYVESSGAYNKNLFASDILTNIVCDASGATAPTYAEGYSWSQLKTKYLTLSTDDKTALQTATANKTSASIIEQAMYRYDYIVAKYNIIGHDTSYDDYIGRNPSSTLISGLAGNSDQYTTLNNTIVIFAVIGGFVAIDAVIFIGKKKPE